MVTGDPIFRAFDDGKPGVGHLDSSNKSQSDSRFQLSNYVMDAQVAAKMAEQQAQQRPSIGRVAGTFAYSLAYSAIQNPLDGVTQLADGALRPLAGGHVIPRLEMMQAPRQVEFGSPEWTAKLAGGGIGTILPFWLGGKVAVRMAEGLKEARWIGPAIQKAGILEENSVAQLTFKGAVYEGVFHPVDETQGSFWGQRAVNFGSGGLSFLALGYANKGLRNSSFGKSILESKVPALPLTGELLIDGASGATAGVTDTVLHAIAGGAAPSWENVAQSAGEYGLMSIFLRLGRLPIDKAVNEKAPSPANKSQPADNVPQDPNSLRATLPFDKTTLRRSVMSTGEEAELIGVQRGSKRNLFYREVSDAPDAPRMRVSAQEIDGGKYQQIEHKGQKFAIDAQGKAYSVVQVEPGVYELVLTDKIILDRFNEVQVPWPPIQSQEQYRARQTIKLDDLLFGWRTASSH